MWVRHMDSRHDSEHFEVRGGGEVCVDLAKLVPGHSWVKVGRCGERFWCKVHAVDASAGVLSVTVDNELVGDHGFGLGSRLEVRRAQVLDIATAADMQECQRLACMLGTETDGALAWRMQRACERGER